MTRPAGLLNGSKPYELGYRYCTVCNMWVSPEITGLYHKVCGRKMRASTLDKNAKKKYDAKKKVIKK